MKIKIKSTPEDFQVKELASLPLQKSGDYGVYLLEKRGWNTIDALDQISQFAQIPFARFSYGGKKDRHAHTFQYIAVQGPKINQFSDENFHLTFQGFMDRPMGPDLIDGNQFKIVIRKLSSQQARSAVDECSAVKAFGFPNYFDDQRFGSYDPIQGFLAEKILLGHLNGAAKIALTSIYSENTKEDLERKRFFNDHWKDWKTCESKAITGFERDAFEVLSAGEKGCLLVLNQVPREELSMCFSAYQSFLWNEVARQIIKQKAGNNPLASVPGDAGEYLFYNKLEADDLSYLTNFSIPTAAHNSKMPDDLTAKIYDKVLADRGVKRPMFNKMKIRKAFFKATERSLIIRPEGLTAEALADETDQGKSKVVLSFDLPRGSYATMLLKRLFLE